MPSLPGRWGRKPTSDPWEPLAVPRSGPGRRGSERTGSLSDVRAPGPGLGSAGMHEGTPPRHKGPVPLVSPQPNRTVFFLGTPEKSQNRNQVPPGKKTRRCTFLGPQSKVYSQCFKVQIQHPFQKKTSQPNDIRLTFIHSSPPPERKITQ